MNADGSGSHRLSGESARYAFLSLSPDRTRIAYCNAFPGPQHDIWIVNVDGTDARQLTGINTYEGMNTGPFWSPDGAKIAFTSSRTFGKGP
jgi:Tol biopolymer transport system component